MTPTPSLDLQKLRRHLATRGLISVILFSLLLFVPARSIRFWQGWALMAVQFGAAAAMSIYFYKRAPQTLQRRMLRKEKITEQKFIIAVWRVIGATTIMLSAFDYRFHWSRAWWKPVPLWLELASLLIVLAGYILHFEVLKANRFGASVIQVETGQTVITTGPYSILRHPMYLAFAAMGVFTPLALGSFIAFPISALILPLIILRLLNEEKMLRRDLPGYAEYCQCTPHRLIPFLW